MPGGAGFLPSTVSLRFAILKIQSYLSHLAPLMLLKQVWPAFGGTKRRQALAVATGEKG